MPRPAKEDTVVGAMRDHFLRYTDEVVDKYKTQIHSAVGWYLGTLPRHIQSSESQDLTSEAKIAFVEALKTWDPRKGELWTYVNYRLRGAMQDYLRKRGKDPVAGMYEWITSAAHVYLAFNREGMTSTDVQDDSMIVEYAMKELDEQEQTVVNEYYKGDRTFKEIGKDIGLSESQVSRICKTATQKLRKKLRKDD